MSATLERQHSKLRGPAPDFPSVANMTYPRSCSHGVQRSATGDMSPGGNRKVQLYGPNSNT